MNGTKQFYCGVYVQVIVITPVERDQPWRHCKTWLGVAAGGISEEALGALIFPRIQFFFDRCIFFGRCAEVTREKNLTSSF